MDIPPEREPEPLGESDVETIADWLADALDDALDNTLRVDAGEEGRIWIALRDVQDDDDERASRMVFEQTEQLLADVPEEVGPDFESRISSGRAEDDIVFVCELYQSQTI